MSSTILFIDDHDILYRSGTRCVLNFPIRHCVNPLIKSDRSWETAIAWIRVYRDQLTGKYQVWYQAFAGDRAIDPTHLCVVCYAESDDGIHFIKPDLNLFNFNKIKDANIVLVGNDGHSLRYANSVIIDPKDKDPDRRYKMAYFDFAQDGKTEYPGLCVAFFPGGIHWTKHSRAPLLKSSCGNYGQTVPFESDRIDLGISRFQCPMPLMCFMILGERFLLCTERGGSMGQMAECIGNMVWDGQKAKTLLTGRHPNFFVFLMSWILHTLSFILLQYFLSRCLFLFEPDS